jgi:hypothetical protein
MPQMEKGGKFVFGKSLVRDGFSIQFPPQAVAEYDIALEGKVYLFTGSKSTGDSVLHERDCCNRPKSEIFWKIRPPYCVTSWKKVNSSPTKGGVTVGLL